MSKIRWVREVVYSSDDAEEAFEELRQRSKNSSIPLSCADKQNMLNPPESEGRFIVFYIRMVEDD